MKNLLFTILLFIPMIAVAQDNTWERINNGLDQDNPDKKYLTGAVPEIDGKVIFSTTIKAPDKTRQQIYDILLNYMTLMTKEPNQFEQSRIVLATPESGEIIGTYQEWLVFKNKALVLDRTRFFYNIAVNVSDGKAEVKISRIYYLYEEERDPQRIQAEDWITDKYGLTKKKNKLSRVSGKFRRKTIDRKDFIFNKFQSLLNS